MIPKHKSLAGFYVHDSFAPKSYGHSITASGLLFFQVVELGVRPNGYAAQRPGS
jgi:hypothetical protein